MPIATAGCAASTARRRSIPAPIRPIRSRPALKRRRSPASCPAPTISRPIAAAPCRSPPTMPDPALSRRGAHRRLLRAGARCSMRSRAKLGIEPHEVRLQEPRAARADAVRQHHQQAFRQRRLSGSAAPRAWPRSTSTAVRAAPDSSGEPDGRLIGVGLADLLRAGRARHLGLCTAGAFPMVPGHEQAHGAADARRRARTARRRAFARPGPGDDAGAGRARNPRHRHGQDQASCTATPR